MPTISDAEWKDALAAVELAMAIEGVREQNELSDVVYNSAINALLDLQRHYLPEKGTFRRFVYPTIHRAVKMGIATHAKKPSAQTLNDDIISHRVSREYRFESALLDRLPRLQRRAVVLHIHLGLSRFETGLLLGGVHITQVSRLLARAAFALGLHAQNV